MIIVTGAKRSGTSLWMQILQAAGFPLVGSAFPLQWKESIGEANPEGFYESLLRRGIYWRTNPHPRTGQYLFPEDTRRHVVKVFVPGLVRSDRAFIDHVIATIRPWREQCTSIRKLLDREAAWFEEKQAASDRPLRRPPRSPHPPEVTWWYDNYKLVRDLATRRYPYHLVSHGSLLAEPTTTIARALRFLDGGELEPAAAVVRPQLYRNRDVVYESEHIDADDIAVFDRLYETIHRRDPLTADLLGAMNEVQGRMLARFPPPRRRPVPPADD